MFSLSGGAENQQGTTSLDQTTSPPITTESIVTIVAVCMGALIVAVIAIIAVRSRRRPSARKRTRASNVTGPVVTPVSTTKEMQMVPNLMHTLENEKKKAAQAAKKQEEADPEDVSRQV